MSGCEKPRGDASIPRITVLQHGLSARLAFLQDPEEEREEQRTAPLEAEANSFGGAPCEPREPTRADLTRDESEEEDTGSRALDAPGDVREGRAH